MAQEFHVASQVAILAVSLFVTGLGTGPLLVGPLSELYGRSIIYRVSFGMFFALSWPVAFAPDIGTSAVLGHDSAQLTAAVVSAVFLVFRFLTGFFGSTFLSVAGGSVSDLFPKDKVAK